MAQLNAAFLAQRGSAANRAGAVPAHPALRAVADDLQGARHTYEQSSYWRVAKGFRQPRECRMRRPHPVSDPFGCTRLSDSPDLSQPLSTSSSPSWVTSSSSWRPSFCTWWRAIRCHRAPGRSGSGFLDWPRHGLSLQNGLV